jgi:hypothetical protein
MRDDRVAIDHEAQRPVRIARFVAAIVGALTRNDREQ